MKIMMVVSNESGLRLLFHILFMHLAIVFVTGNDELKLTLTNDGPAILDSQLTFYASINDSYFHKFVFLDNTNLPREKEVYGVQDALLRLRYSSRTFVEGRYVMAVNVSRRIQHDQWSYPIASGKMEFHLSKFMVGEIAVYQEGATDDDYYSTTKEITFTAIIHDPSKYFDDKDISYSWSINNLRFAYDGNKIKYNFTKGGKYNIASTVVAYGRNTEIAAFHYFFKWGYFQKEISVEEPVTLINVTGNTWLKHGDLLSLNLSCDGSGSFEYCWDVVAPNETDTNITCKEPVVSTTCNFFIIRYFPIAGYHYIKVFAGNFLSNQQKTIEVRIYDVSRRPQLSTVIIPIVCSVLTIVIIIMGVAYHIQHRKQYTIEVADFDFHQSEDLTEKTFFERLHESFKNALCRTNQFEYQKQEETGKENSTTH